MKRNHKIMTVALVGSALMFGSCNDWLSLDPEDSVTASKYWKTESDVESALTGIYCSVLNASSKMYTDGEIRGDYTTVGGTLYSPYYSMYNGDLTSSNTLVKWTTYYTAINNCNLLLEKADEALANDASFSATQCLKYKAQATVIRAMMYFYLIRTYKDVPYIKTAYYDDTAERDCAPTAQLDILNDLIAELEQVQQEGNLDYTYSLTNVAQNKGQVTMYALKALLADMYRWQGALTEEPATAQAAYARCVELCDEIINCGQFRLIDVPKTDAKAAVGSYLEDATTHADSCFYVLIDNAAADFFKQVYVDGNSDESIFELQVDDYTATPYYTMCAYRGSAYYVPNFAHIRDDIFLSTENTCASGSGANYEDVRYRMCAYSGFNWKYAGADLEGNIYASSASEYEKNIIVYRLAEIYLMKAEALVQEAFYQQQTGGTETQKYLLQAYKAVFKVRDRAAAVEATDVSVGSGSSMQVVYWDQLREDQDFELSGSNTLTALNMEQFVLDEQGREMALEGRRWFDVLRTAARNNYGAGSCTGGSLNYLLNIVVNATAIDKVTYLRNAYKNPLRHYLPYPVGDVRTNDLLNQNPAYGDE
jgi:hypothetical protein